MNMGVQYSYYKIHSATAGKTMNFWKNPENNSLKLILVVIVIAVLGYFAYSNFHENGLEGTGKVVQKKRKTEDPKTWRCLDGGPTVALGVTKMGATPMPIVSTPLSNAVHIPWITLRLDNPADCPVDVSQMSFELSSNDITTWPPVQMMQLMHLGSTVAVGGTQLDGMKEVPGGVLPDEAIIPLSGGTVTPTGAGSANHTFVFNFPTSSVRIYPHSFEIFRLFANSQNVPANLYGYDGTAGSGMEVWFKLQLTQLLGTPVLGGTPLNQTVLGGTIPATIATPVIKIH